MKKTLVVFLIVLIIMLSGCKEKDVDYYCEFTFYNNEDRNGALAVDYYKIRKDSTIIEIHKLDGDIWLIDSTEVSMLCIEWNYEEEIE